MFRQESSTSGTGTFLCFGKARSICDGFIRLVKIATFYLLCQPQADLRHVQQEGLIGRSLLVLNEPPRTRWRASGNRQQKAYSELSPSFAPGASIPSRRAGGAAELTSKRSVAR
jgi:hypothetical protein